MMWAALTACSLSALLWGASLFWHVIYWGQPTVITLRSGVVGIGHNDFPFNGWNIQWRPLEWGQAFGFTLPGWRFGPNTSGAMRIPLWIPTTLLLLPVVFWWRRDRRRIRPGCCLRCGYDLTGNTSGVCSECGEKLTPVSKAPSRQGRA